MKVTCINPCLKWKSLWEVGDSTDVEGNVAPEHFVSEKEYKAEKELTKEEKRVLAIRATGHTVETAKKKR